MTPLDTEELLSFRDAARSLPRCRAGKPIHVSTIHRWAGRGLRGVRLESMRLGVTFVTSREALARFFAALSAAPTTTPSVAPGAAARAREAQAALARELAPRRHRMATATDRGAR